VLSVDEKSQIQALNRTQPGLPLKKGRAGTMTYARHNLHFTPTSASWITLVERFFGIINDDAIRRCVFRDVDTIKAYLEHHNAEPGRWSGPPGPPISSGKLPKGDKR
jgi:hypothetical protein